MRRAVFALLGTAIGTSLLVGAKLGTTATGSDGIVLDPAGGPAGEGPTKAAASTAAAPTASSRPTPAGKPTGTARRTTAPAVTVRTTAATKPPATGLKSGTYTGAGFTHEYGTVRVTITVAGGVVTAASATYPTEKPTSRNINEDAVPKLNSWAVAAKTSANISTVSGATLTSAAYKKSLQSALDKARA